MSMLPVGFGASGDYTIEESLRFNASQSSYLSWTPASAGNLKTWTFSAWVKRGAIGSRNVIFSAQSTNEHTVRFEGDSIQIFRYQAGVGYTWNLVTSSVYRDPSAWYHIVVAYDTTQATASNRVKLYVNGVQVTSFSTANYPAQNSDYSINGAELHTLGKSAAGATYFDAYLTEVNFIDGQALDASSFGETDATTGVWKPKGYTGTYGTNGFYLPMKLDNTTEGFNTVTYLGNSSNQQIRGVGFSPDLIWIKNRNGVVSHGLYDVIRGAERDLRSDTTSAEGFYSGFGVKSFDTDGFTVQGAGDVSNLSGNSYVAWCWDAGSSTVSNTDGSITSSVRANPTYGFSVVTWTGNGTISQSVGHGLGSAPKMIITKNRTDAWAWGVMAQAANGGSGHLGRLVLDGTDAWGVNDAYFDSTQPTSSVFYIDGTGGYGGINASGKSYIAYCFSEVSGYSKFGSYTGTGAQQTITTGFKPAFVLVKDASVADSWRMYDNTRSITEDKVLYPNLSNAEDGATDHMDFTDNGFTVYTNNSTNRSGSTWIYMAFKDTREYAFWLDDSGNNNDWQPNGGITTESTVTDTPTPYLGGGNYAVLNPLSLTSTGGTISDANLKLQTTTGTPHVIATTSMAISGKAYCEFAVASTLGSAIGPIVIDLDKTSSSSNGVLYIASGTVYNPASNTGYPTFTNGDLLGVAYDSATKTAWFAKNGTWITGDPSTGTGGFTNSAFGSNVGFGWDDETSSFAATIYANFGQRPFAYTPPTGFKALHTGNLPDSSIVDGSEYMNTVLFSANNSTQDITGLEFAPDFVWLKSRSNAYSHELFDKLRGVNEILYSNSTAVETTTANSLTSFNSDGFSLGASSNANFGSGSSVAWNWKANGTGVSNTDGSITSTVSANPTAGFSIVTYTGTGATGTVGHGLGAAPAMLIIKNRDDVGNWMVWHQSDPDDLGYLNLTNSIAGTGRLSWAMNNTQPTSSVFTVTGDINTGASADKYVAYCFAEVEGYSKFGSYTGNGSADGPFVYTGFRPAFVMVKSSSFAGTFWVIHDTARSASNAAPQRLFLNAPDAEFSTSAGDLDILSNGFKPRNLNDSWNRSGATYIFMAFAENPFKNSLAR